MDLCMTGKCRVSLNGGVLEGREKEFREKASRVNGCWNVRKLGFLLEDSSR